MKVYNNRITNQVPRALGSNKIYRNYQKVTKLLFGNI